MDEEDRELQAVEMRASAATASGHGKRRERAVGIDGRVQISTLLAHVEDNVITTDVRRTELEWWLGKLIMKHGTYDVLLYAS